MANPLRLRGRRFLLALALALDVAPSS